MATVETTRQAEDALPGRPFLRKGVVSFAVWIVLTSLCYVALVPVGVSSMTDGYQFAMIWPSSALAACAIYTTGGTNRWAATIGVLIGSYLSKSLFSHEGHAVSLIFAGSAVVGPFLFAILLSALVPPKDFTVRTDSLFLLLICALLASSISGSIGAVALDLVYGSDVVDRWIRWTLAEAVAIAAICPIVLHMTSEVRDASSRMRLVEGGLYLVLLVLVLVVVFSARVDPVLSLTIATWLSLPLLLLAMGRGSRLHGAFGLLAITAIGIAFLLSRSGVFASNGVDVRGAVLLFQVFVLAAVASMAIVGLHERDRLIAEVLRSEHAILESVTDAVMSVASRNGLLTFANQRAMQIIEGDGFDGLFFGHDGTIGIAGGSIMSAVRTTTATGAPSRIVFVTRSGRRMEADLYSARDGVTIYARDVTEAAIEREKIDLIAQEMNHRVKNMFAMAGSIVSASARGALTPADVVSKARARITSLSAAYQASREGGEAGLLDVDLLVKAVLAPYMHDGKVDLEGESVTLPLASSTPLGLVLHELATNAVKYGCLGDAGGNLRIVWGTGAGRLVIYWTESIEVVGQIVAPPERKGYGSRMIETAAAQMGGEVDMCWLPEGLSVAISLPLEGPARAAAPKGELVA